MICPKCGYEITGNYCSNCGMPLNTEDSSLTPQEREKTAAGTEYAENLYQEKDRRAHREAPKPRSSRKRAESGSGSQSHKKEMQKKDARLKKMETELGQLKSRTEISNKSLERMESERRVWEKAERRSYRDGDDRRSRGADRDAARDAEWSAAPERSAAPEWSTAPERDTYGKLKAAGAGVVVLCSRLMQLGSALLMAAMTAVMLRSFWEHGQALGDIRYVIAEHNYGLAAYAGVAGVTLFMGVLWCFWILSRKGAGGGIRLKKYDTGRGFLPFLLCMAVVIGAGMLRLKLPADAIIWNGHLMGLRAALEAVYDHRNGLFFCSGLGAVLSFVRKLLRV